MDKCLQEATAQESAMQMSTQRSEVSSPLRSGHQIQSTCSQKRIARGCVKRRCQCSARSSGGKAANALGKVEDALPHVEVALAKDRKERSKGRGRCEFEQGVSQDGRYQGQGFSPHRAEQLESGQKGRRTEDDEDSSNPEPELIGSTLSGAWAEARKMERVEEGQLLDQG